MRNFVSQYFSLNNNKMESTEISIPEITDDVLAERMNRIRFVVPAMSGIDGKPYVTDEKDEKLFDLFYVESLVNPRTQSFNFDENRKLTGKADGLKELAIVDVIPDVLFGLVHDPMIGRAGCFIFHFI